MKRTYEAVDVMDLVPKYIPEEVMDRFGDTHRVSFGDAFATLINVDQLSDILMYDFDVDMNEEDFKAEFGENTLIDLGS